MKKIFLLILLLVLAIFGSRYIKDINSNSLIKNNVEIKEEVLPEEETTDIFNEYYNDAAMLMKNMTFEEKVGQLFLVRYDKSTATKQITNYYAGGFVLFAKDFQNHTKDSITKEISEKQSTSKIPLAMAVDEEGGYVTRVSRYTAFRSEKFKSNRYLFETGGYDLVKTSEKEKAELLLSLGLNLNLAPVADVSVDENDYINNRTFGKDANETSVFISNIVSYNNESLISSCLKHFPGYGNNVDTHSGIAIDNRNYDNFINNDFLPFKSGIEAGVPTILVSHNIVNSMDSEYPASLSKKVINELRNTLGFSGIVITDDLAMGAVSKFVDANNAATLAINAGNDMIITSDFETMYNEVLNNVKSGIIKEETIDKAVKRILAWKYAYKIIK